MASVANPGNAHHGKPLHKSLLGNDDSMRIRNAIMYRGCEQALTTCRMSDTCEHEMWHRRASKAMVQYGKRGTSYAHTYIRTHIHTYTYHACMHINTCSFLRAVSSGAHHRCRKHTSIPSSLRNLKAARSLPHLLLPPVDILQLLPTLQNQLLPVWRSGAGVKLESEADVVGFLP